jgi:transcription termination factor Rho
MSMRNPADPFSTDLPPEPDEEFAGDEESLLAARREAAADLDDLQRLTAHDLLGHAGTLGLELLPNLTRGELVHAILTHRLARHGLGWTQGILDVVADGFGFLRSAQHDFEPGPHDVYVSPSQIRRLNLKPGHTIEGPVRPPRRGEKFFALLHVDRIDGGDVAALRRRVPFAARTPLLPDERLHLDGPHGNRTLRAIDLLAPWGKGQRVLIAAPPGSGRTRLLADTATALLANHPDLHVALCLLDERPEEMTAIRRALGGHERADVVASTFDQPPARHVAIAELALARCQRLVEAGRDVVLAMDSLTALTRAYHLELGYSGRLLCAGLDAAAVVRPKKLFGAARKCEEGGSLTILATVLTGTGSRVDQAIAEEFCNRGNAEVTFDPELAQRHVDLPLDALRTTTRREDLLLDRPAIEGLQRLRERLGGMPVGARTAHLEELLARFGCNRDVLAAL